MNSRRVGARAIVRVIVLILLLGAVALLGERLGRRRPRIVLVAAAHKGGEA